MTRKLNSETSSQKIDVSADIIFEFLTLQSDFVILDLKVSSQEAQGSVGFRICVADEGVPFQVFSNGHSKVLDRCNFGECMVM